jgi:heme/copper-type cytochrome/quinol oxidase subunit 4
MILFYFISAIILSVATLLVNKRRTAQIMISLFAAIQIAFAYYAYLHLNQTDLSYFTYDPLGVIFLSVLSIIFPATIYHGFRYFTNGTTKRFYYYHSALIGVIAVITGAYLANEATVVWILVEATTLLASVLIYHEKTKMALEATWKYIFLCSVGIGVSKRGDFTIFGDYIISKGEFVFTFEELFSRKFDILKGSKIGWRGDPYDGTIDLQATHKVRTSLNGLQFQMDSTSLFNTKVDVLCVINLQNDLFNPDIRFSIDFLNVPETTKEVIYASLDTTDQSAMSQQILSLLILNSFSYTDYAPGLTSNSFNLLSNQINNLLSRLFVISVNFS